MLCDQFHCRPTEAWDELQRAPSGFLQQVIEYRRYAAAYVANQHDPNGWRTSKVRTLAMEIEHALAEEAIARG